MPPKQLKMMMGELVYLARSVGAAVGAAVGAEVDAVITDTIVGGTGAMAEGTLPIEVDMVFARLLVKPWVEIASDTLEIAATP